MPTKTITLELDAYEKLRERKRPGESFSAVVRRAIFADSAPTGRALAEFYASGGSGIPERYLDTVQKAAETDRPPDNPWA